LWKLVLDDISAKNLSLTAAGVAFFAMFSLFPSLAALIALWGLWMDPDSLVLTLQPLDDILPPDIYTILLTQTQTIAQTHPDRLTLGVATGFLLALWSARAGVGALMQAMNMIHNLPNRSLVPHYLTAVGMTLTLVVLILIGLMANVGLPLLLRFWPLETTTQLLLTILRWSLGVGVLYLAIRILHTYTPNSHQTTQRFPIMPGALFSTFGILAVSYGLSLYIENFDSYNKTYGSLGAAIATLMWLYLTILLVLIGAVLSTRLKHPTP
jgi:membrane protein